MGGMFGGGDSAEDLNKMSMERWGMDKPLYQNLIGMLQSLITTGGTQPRTGIIGQAQEQSGRAAGKARGKTEEGLARTGLAGTPFGTQIMGDFDLNAFLEIAGIKTQMQEQDYWGHLQMLLPLLTQTMALPTQGLSAAAGAEAQQRSPLEQLSGLMAGLGEMAPDISVT